MLFIYSQYYSFPTNPRLSSFYVQLKHTQGPAETVRFLTTVAYVLPCFVCFCFYFWRSKLCVKTIEGLHIYIW
jgi:hypothetical protein